MKGMFWRWVQRVTKKADIKNELPEEIVKRGVEIALYNHVMNYPHSYFLRNAPKYYEYRGRW